MSSRLDQSAPYSTKYSSQGPTKLLDLVLTERGRKIAHAPRIDKDPFVEEPKKNLVAKIGVRPERVPIAPHRLPSQVQGEERAKPGDLYSNTGVGERRDQIGPERLGPSVEAVEHGAGEQLERSHSGNDSDGVGIVTARMRDYRPSG